MTNHTAPELKRLHEFLDNQLADPNTAPAVVFLDPDLPPSEWEKQYHMDVVYIRADLHRAEVNALVVDRDEWKRRYFQMRDERDKAKIAASNYAEFNHEWRKRCDALHAHTEAAVRRALETAARIECDADFVAVWGPYEHGVNDMQTAIRALADNPAQFIGGLNVYAR